MLRGVVGIVVVESGGQFGFGGRGRRGLFGLRCFVLKPC